MNIKTNILVGALFWLGAALAAPAFAQSADADKQAAVDRYLRAVPMAQMLDDTYTQLASQLPVERQAQFLADMRGVIKTERLEEIARAAMLKTFTTEELSALADFYSSKHGASAMAKFGAYMGDVMPQIMQEIQRAVREIQARAKQ